MNQAAAEKPSNWNLPNALTTLRIAMVPFFGAALLVDGGDSILWRCVAAGLFAAAMITDKIDGDIARARNLVTDFGKIADPIADKALTGMALIGLSIVGSQNAGRFGEFGWLTAGGEVWWWVTILVLVREWSVTLLRLSLLKRIVVPAAQSGKLKTTAQGAALFWLSLPLVADNHAWGTVGEVIFYIAQGLLAVAVALTLWSGYEFYRVVWEQRHDLNTPADNTAD